MLDEKPLTGLIRVYKDYYPDIFIGDTTKAGATLFKHPDPAWAEQLAFIQQQYRDAQAQSKDGQSFSFKVRRGDANGFSSKSSIIPEVQTSNALEVSTKIFNHAHRKCTDWL